MNSRFYIFRELGVRTYDGSKITATLFAQQKLFLESYFDLYTCLLLHIYGFWLDSGPEGFLKSYFTNPYDASCFVLVIFMFVLATFFPYWSYQSVKKNFSELSKPEV